MAVKQYVQHDGAGHIVGIALADEANAPPALEGGGMIALAPGTHVDMHAMRVDVAKGELRPLSREEQLLEEQAEQHARDMATRDAPDRHPDTPEVETREEQLRRESAEHRARDHATR